MRYKLDTVRVQEERLNVQGWAFGREPETETDIWLSDRSGRRVEAEFSRVRRDAVAEAWFEAYLREHGSVERELGFELSWPYEPGGEWVLHLAVDGREKRIVINDVFLRQFNSGARKRRERLAALCNAASLRRGMRDLLCHGPGFFARKLWHKFCGQTLEAPYDPWIRAQLPGEEKLAAQREAQRHFLLRPRFSIVVPVYRTPEYYLCAMLDSVLAQTYPEWELCLVDASAYSDETEAAQQRGRRPAEVLAEYAARDSRIRWQSLAANMGFSDNTNAAIEMAGGDWIVLGDHDDLLTPDALFEVAALLNERPWLQLIYSDEDKIDADGREYFEPHIKPDYSPELLRSVNYICHLCCIRKSLLERLGYPWERAEYDGAQDYDLVLRCCEVAERMDRELEQRALGAASAYGARVQAESEAHPEEQSKQHPEQCAETLTAALTEKLSHECSEETRAEAYFARMRAEGRYTSAHIGHVQRVLYHWRSHRASTAARPEAKLYAFQAGARALKAHCERSGLPLHRLEQGVSAGIYHCVFDTSDEPLVSVIIPNKDHTEDLDKAIRSVWAGSYRKLEFIVVENNSVEPKTWRYYEQIQAELPVRVVRWESAFNYSAINNFGVRHASGEYLLFLNNDVEMLAPDAVSELLGLVRLPGMGAVGARLMYPDGSIQHAGVVVGFGGIAGHSYIGLRDDTVPTYMNRALTIQNYSAVTAACLMSRRTAFEQAGGFTEALEVAFNDIDYCMKLRASGLRVAYTPYALFNHYESKSRGAEDTPEKVARFNREIVRFAERWHGVLRAGDPYYHPWLTLMKSNYALRDLAQEKLGEPFPLEILKDIV